MKKIVFLIFLVTLSLHTFSIDSLGRKELVYACLDMEKKSGFNVHEEEYLLLDSILNSAEKRINPKDSTQKNYPKNIMLEIHKILEDYNIVGDYDQEDAYKNLLSYSLRNKKFDCDKYSFVFLAIAERLNLPLYAVLLPSHMAIEWADSSHTFYWETTNKSERTKEIYVHTFHLNKYHFKQNMFLNRISKNDLTLCFKYNTGITNFMLGNYKEALHDFDSCHTLGGIHPYLHEMKVICQNKIIINKNQVLILEHPTYDSLRLERAKAYIELKGTENYTLALNDLNFIIVNNPSHSEAYVWRGIANMNLFMLGKLNLKNPKYKKSLEDFDFVLAIEPTNYNALLNKSILNRWARNYDSALQDIEKAIKVKKSEEALVEKGNIYYNQKKYQEAIDLYNEALAINEGCFHAIQCRGFANIELEKRDEAADDFFHAYYQGIMPYEYFQKLTMMRNDY
jgi:tetratricopeptide (TPR) repeat protein